MSEAKNLSDTDRRNPIMLLFDLCQTLFAARGEVNNGCSGDCRRNWDSFAGFGNLD